MDLKSKIILISGPTSSGKSNFALKIAKKINGEIINADSMQVYKEVKILTSRPKKRDYKNINHHLYGFLNVKKKFSTGHWLKLTVKKIKEIKKKNKVPIVVGGTGLYFKALTDGLVKIPVISLKVKNQIRKLQKKLGQKKFYKKLLELDPLVKKQINENDVQRTIRAFEIKKTTNISITQWFQKTKKLFDDKIFFKIYIDYPRLELIKKIEDRINFMFKNGADKEVKRFLKLKVKPENSSNKIIGIFEISNYLKGKLSLEETKEKILIKTRQYAKRQSTWARGHMINWHKIEPKDLNILVKKIK